MAGSDRHQPLHLRQPEPDRTYRKRRVAAGGALAVVVGAAVAGGLLATSGGHPAPHATGPGPASGRGATTMTRPTTTTRPAAGPRGGRASTTTTPAAITTTTTTAAAAAPAGTATATTPATATAQQTPTTAPALPPPSEVLVEVLNGSGRGGAAAQAGRALKQDGFLLNGTGNAASFLNPVTLVLYPPGEEAAAERLDRYVVGDSELEVSSKVPAGVVDLVIGDSFGGIASVGVASS